VKIINIFIVSLFIGFLVQPTLAQDYQKYMALSYHALDSLVMHNYRKRAIETCLLISKAAREKARQDFGKTDSTYISYTKNVGFFYSGKGNKDKALAMYIEAKNKQAHLNKQSVLYTSLLNNIAHIYQRKGNLVKAEFLFLQIQDILQKKGATTNLPYAKLLHDLGQLYLQLEQLDKALPLFLAAKNIREGKLGKEHPKVASILLTIGDVYFQKENYKKALAMNIRAKEIVQKAQGSKSLEMARANIALARNYKRIKNYKTAIELFQTAAATYALSLGKRHPYYLLCMNAMAVVYKEKGDLEKAWELVQQAIQINTQTAISLNITSAWADSIENVAYTSNSNLEKAIFSLKIVYNLLELEEKSATTKEEQLVVAKLVNRLLDKFKNKVSTEKDKLRMLAQSSYWLQISLSLMNAEEHIEEAFALADQNKSALLLQATQSADIYRIGNLPDSLAEQDKKLLKKQSRLQAKLQENRPKAQKETLRDALNNVNIKIDALSSKIKEGYPKYYELKYQQASTETKEVQALLDDKTALIEYVIVEEGVHIFKIQEGQAQWLRHIVAKKELDKNIRALHEVLSSYRSLMKDEKKSYQRFIRLAHWFYQNLLEPVLQDNAQIEHLVIVPDGELGHLPFETFLVEQAPQEFTPYKELHYVLDDYKVSYNYSAALWKQNKEESNTQNNGQMLGVAADYTLELPNNLSPLRLPSDQDLRAILNPLPAAKKEIEGLQEKFEGLFVFGTEASEKLVKQKAADYAILHFAVHGVLDNRRPVLSSLAFSEDGDSVENNFWQAHEISKMDLNANLVVLSACETGYGRFEQGNGIASLARSFMYAGAPALIVSLWQVNDYATAVIMENMYKNLAAGQPKDEALRQAKLQYVDMAVGVAGHPAYWSPFIQIGSTAPVTIQQKTNAWGWRAGLLLGIPLLGLGFWWWRRQKAA